MRPEDDIDYRLRLEDELRGEYDAKPRTMAKLSYRTLNALLARYGHRSGLFLEEEARSIINSQKALSTFTPDLLEEMKTFLLKQKVTYDKLILQKGIGNITAHEICDWLMIPAFKEESIDPVNEAYEKAALVCAEYANGHSSTAMDLAYKIRALKVNKK